MTGPRPGRAVAALVAASLAVPFAANAMPAWADDVRSRSWHLAALNVAEAHKVSRGDGVTVAVIDTGVDASHPDLAGAVLPGVDLVDPANAAKGWQRDTQGHGTSVASIIAGRGHGPGGRDGVLGIAPRAKILPINVYDPAVKGARSEVIAAGIKLAVDRGAGVICIAQAGPFHPDEEAAIQYANARDVLVIAGVGNPPARLVQSPANITATVAVTGFDRAGKPVTTVEGVLGSEIDLAAPGGDIQAALPGGRYDAGTGTSTATAIVAGAAALIRARYPQARRNEQLQRLVWTATDIGEPGKDWIFGWGGVNLVNALTTQPRDPEASATPSPAGSTAAAGPIGRTDDRGPILVIAIGSLLLVALLALAIALLIRQSRRRRPGPDRQLRGWPDGPADPGPQGPPAR